MSAEIKFCGLTRPQDAELAVELGASYVGVIFAGGPRMLTIERAIEVLDRVPERVSRVGVFAEQTADEIGRVADRLGLDVVQLHSTSDAARIDALRRGTGAKVWSVCRVTGSLLPPGLDEVIAASDGLLLDAYAPGALGGTGTAIPWLELTDALARIRSPLKPIILAGGLRPENVARAIAALSPDVVDVSSGVESAPGIKDPSRMRAFRDAVTTSIPT